MIDLFNFNKMNIVSIDLVFIGDSYDKKTGITCSVYRMDSVIKSIIQLDKSDIDYYLSPAPEEGK